MGSSQLLLFTRKRDLAQVCILSSIISSLLLLAQVVLHIGFLNVSLHELRLLHASVSVVITGLGPDFTKMESFGKVDEFAETLVGS